MQAHALPTPAYRCRNNSRNSRVFRFARGGQPVYSVGAHRARRRRYDRWLNAFCRFVTRMSVCGRRGQCHAESWEKKQQVEEPHFRGSSFMLFTRSAVVGVSLVLSAAFLATIDSGAAAVPVSDMWLARALSASVSDRVGLDTLAELDRFAAVTGGNRAAGSPGFELSRGLVTQTLTSAGYRVTEQPVPYQRFVVDAERLTIDGTGVRVLMAQYVPSTPVGGVSGAVAVVDAAGADPTPGCQSGDFPAGPGAVAVVRSGGGCTTAAKATAAAAAGWATLLVYDVSPSPWTVIRRRATGTPLPVGFVSQLDAQRIAQAVGAGTVELRGHDVPDVTVNVLAETTGGSADNVIMAGAHLDSTQDGPGINDNGSSVAALLQTAMRLAPLQHRVTNRVRFAFWGAEELVTIGSIYYIATLPADQLAAISLYLNFEMLAS